MNRIGIHKLVLLGDTYVGKSSLVLRYVRDEFSENLESTVGAAFMTKTIIVDGKTIKFEIWDTAGQERYRSLTPMYYRGAKAAVVMYDITSYDSFNCAKSWIEELGQRTNNIAVIVLVANKIDLAEDRKVSKEEGQQYALKNDMLFYEISVKDKIGVDDVFLEIGKRLPDAPDLKGQSLDSYSIGSSSRLPNRTESAQSSEGSARSGSCC